MTCGRRQTGRLFPGLALELPACPRERARKALACLPGGPCRGFRPGARTKKRFRISSPRRRAPRNEIPGLFSRGNQVKSSQYYLLAHAQLSNAKTGAKVARTDYSRRDPLSIPDGSVTAWFRWRPGARRTRASTINASLQISVPGRVFRVPTGRPLDMASRPPRLRSRHRNALPRAPRQDRRSSFGCS